MQGLHSRRGHLSRLSASCEWDEICANIDIHTLVRELRNKVIDTRTLVQELQDKVDREKSRDNRELT